MEYYVNQIYENHLSIINKTKNNIDIINCIIGDMLMGKVTSCNKTIFLTINKNVLSLIKKWYQLSRSIQASNCNLLNYNSRFENFVVYRGINLNEPLNLNEHLIHPIPFSTCLDYNNSLLWLNNNYNHSYVLKITICKNIPFTFTGNLFEGNEIILPAGKLKIKSINDDNINNNINSDVVVVECELIHYSYKEMKERFKEIETIFY
jgi:hypothetical protein